MASNYLPLSSDSASPSPTSPLTPYRRSRRQSHPGSIKSSRSRIRFFILRLFLPFFSLATILGLIVASGLAPDQLGISQCRGGCLKWDKVEQLANRWGLGFKNTFGDHPKKLNVLHLIDKDTSNILMDRWFLHSYGKFPQLFVLHFILLMIISTCLLSSPRALTSCTLPDAFSSRSDIIASSALWGPDFEDWDKSQTLSRNIGIKYGRADFFDAVMVYYNNDQAKFLHIDSKPWFKQIKDLSAQGKGVIIIDRPHEMRDMRKEEFYTRQ